MPDGTQSHDFWFRSKRSNTYCATLLCDDFEKGNIYKIYILYTYIDSTSQYGGAPYHLHVKCYSAQQFGVFQITFYKSVPKFL